MADRMTDSNGNPLQTPDGKPMFIEKSVQTVEMTGEVCGHIYYLDGPDKRASSTDATREDIVDEADRINADRVSAILRAFRSDYCPACNQDQLQKTLEEADYRLNPDGPALGFKRLFG